MDLTKEQQGAVKLAITRHNFCLLGQAGTGKSCTIKNIVAALQGESRSVAVACTTGTACSQLGCHSQTVHRYDQQSESRQLSCYKCANNPYISRQIIP